MSDDPRRSMRPHHLLLSLAWTLGLGLPVTGLAQGKAVVTQTVNLRPKPSTQRRPLTQLSMGDTVELRSLDTTNGFLSVTTADGTKGWVWSRYIVLMAAVPALDAGASDTAGVAAGAFDGCALQGTAKSLSVQQLNDKKNRSVAPRDADIDSAVTVAALLAPGNDSARWHTNRAAEVVAYVHDVKIGGIETTNCGATDSVHRDTHIELVLRPEDAAPNRRVIVEVTPRWRAARKAHGMDWSTGHLKATVLGHWVRVRGWLLFDQEHVTQAENTAPGNPRNWRATVWEIHPVSMIDVVAAPQ